MCGWRGRGVWLGALALVVSCLLAAPVSAEPRPNFDKYDFFSDGNGHFIAVERLKSGVSAAFHGDRKALRPLRVLGCGSRGGPERYCSFRDSRFVVDKAHPNMWRDQEITIAAASHIRCGSEKIPLIAVDAATKKKVLAKVRVKPSVERVSRLLVRNDDGVYFYIDEGSKGAFARNLYRGRRGNMKRLKLRDIVVDMAGSLYIAREGTLKVVPVRGETPTVTWLHKGKTTPLTVVTLRNSATVAFLYDHLGVYLGKKIGTPCDWL